MSLQFREALLRILHVLAGVKLREHTFEIRDRLSFLIGPGKAFRQIEIDLVPPAIHRVVFEELFPEASAD